MVYEPDSEVDTTFHSRVSVKYNVFQEYSLLGLLLRKLSGYFYV